MPPTITLLHPPPHSPERNAIATVWQALRDRELSGRLFAGAHALVDACRNACNSLIAKAEHIRPSPTSLGQNRPINQWCDWSKAVSAEVKNRSAHSVRASPCTRLGPQPCMIGSSPFSAARLAAPAGAPLPAMPLAGGYGADATVGGRAPQKPLPFSDRRRSGARPDRQPADQAAPQFRRRVRGSHAPVRGWKSEPGCAGWFVPRSDGFARRQR